MPEDDLWVNLSPYEKDRIIPEAFGETELGRDLLAQDYMLKQLTASLIYPEENIGREFWDRVYEIAAERYGTTQIPLNTFNKVWIVPEKAVVFAEGQMVYVIESHLKVMLEQDYLAMKQSNHVPWQGEMMEPNPLINVPEDLPPVIATQSPITTEIIRDVIIPEIEKEINEGENFAPLRQIFHSVILAKWYKTNLKESIINKEYVNKNKILGVDVEDKEIKYKIYEQYLMAFRKGVYNFVKEDYDPIMQQVLARKYFSGGSHMNPVITETRDRAMLNQVRPSGRLVRLAGEMLLSEEKIVPQEVTFDRAMLEASEKLTQNVDLLDRIANIMANLDVFTAEQMEVIQRYQLIGLYDRLLQQDELTPEGVVMRLFYDSSYILMYESAVSHLAEKKQISREAIKSVLSIGVQHWYESTGTALVFAGLDKNLGFDMQAEALDRARIQLDHLAEALGQSRAELPFEVAQGDARAMALPQFLSEIELADGEQGMEKFDLITLINPDLASWLEEEGPFESIQKLFEGIGQRAQQQTAVLISLDEETLTKSYPFFYDLLIRAGFEHITNMPDLVALRGVGFNAPYLFDRFLKEKGRKSRVLVGDVPAVQTLNVMIERLNAMMPKLGLQARKDDAKKLSFYFLKQGRNMLIESLLASPQLVDEVIDRHAPAETVPYATVKDELAALVLEQEESAVEPVTAESAQQAMVSTMEEPVGGIDFSLPITDIRTIGNYIVVPFDDEIQNLDALEINGLIPIIHTITPVTSLPFLLSELLDETEAPATSG